MKPVLAILAFVVFLYLVVLIGRVVFDWIRIFARDWRPRGPVLLVAEPVYTLTEPPLKALRRIVPPLRLGAVNVDLSFMILFFGVIILQAILSGLAYR
ncbi:YggT family protein [Phycicoccus flavus]|uniref:YggT family protein n=1 Tax=Phycicoccus flavus TaxID=2502783 RepID=UPI000FEBC86A|nr:YggT family protein [Phycicoccus flavus]NHA66783.1 YggT family protein [Phycicoccus flavus]